MAFNVKVFRTRALTAVVFVILMLAGLLISHWTFFILFSIIHFGCWIEYQRLIGLIDKEYLNITPFHKYGIMLAGWCIMLYFTGPGFNLFSVQLHQIGWWLGLIFLFLLPIMEILFSKNIQLKNIGYSAAGVVYISLCLGLMMDLYSNTVINSCAIDRQYNHIDFVVIPILLIGCVWINDTMAYLVGSIMGKTPLTKISPKKTWEGTIGGIVLGSGLMAFLAQQFDQEFCLVLPFWEWLILAALACIAGVFGDLLKSKLKRMAGVKDSGHFMPGHGGFLDRFDSLLLATPFVWLYVNIFMR